MNVDLLNELLQWAAIGFLGVFVLGLTRQLGHFLVDPREHMVDRQGPPVGKSLPASLLAPAERQRFAELIEARPFGWGAVVVVRENCSGCAGLLGDISEDDAAERPPVLALSFESSPAHREFVEDVADISHFDGEQLKRAGLRSTPFVMLVNRDMRVLHKQITADLRGAARRLEEEQAKEAANSLQPELVKIQEANDGRAST